MRAVDCPCGETLEANTDTELSGLLKEHAKELHPDRYTDADLNILVSTTAYNTEARRDRLSA